MIFAYHCIGSSRISGVVGAKTSGSPISDLIESKSLAPAGASLFRDIGVSDPGEFFSVVAYIVEVFIDELTNFIMAVTCTALWKYGLIDAPTGAAVPTDPEVDTAVQKDRLTISIGASGVVDADAATGFDNLLAAVEAYGEGTFTTNAKIDATQTVTMVAYIHKVERKPPQLTEAIFQTWTDELDVDVTFQWE